MHTLMSFKNLSSPTGCILTCNHGLLYKRLMIFSSLNKDITDERVLECVHGLIYEIFFTSYSPSNGSVIDISLSVFENRLYVKGKDNIKFCHKFSPSECISAKIQNMIGTFVSLQPFKQRFFRIPISAIITCSCMSKG